MKRRVFLLLLFLGLLGISEAPCLAAPQDTLRILAYNVRHGNGMDEVVDLTRAAALINRLHPDVVTLQEIDNRVERTGGVDQSRRLGELTGMESAFGAFMEFQGGEYGMAILSRHPIVSSQNHMLPPGAEPRSVLEARIRVGDRGGAGTGRGASAQSGTEFVLAGIHLYRSAEERLAQAQRAVEVLAERRVPVILAGDFNSTPESEVIAYLRHHFTIPDKGADRFTFPSQGAAREIDFIMYRPEDRFQVIEHRVIDEPLASDHRPVLLVVVLN
jgi:endonuclease/exonuclease/phosphatase family metal-dependent hydrolase